MGACCLWLSWEKKGGFTWPFLVSGNSYGLPEGLKQASAFLFPSSLASFEKVMNRVDLILPDSGARFGAPGDSNPLADAGEGLPLTLSEFG